MKSGTSWPIPRARPRGRPSTPPRSARGPQRAEVDRTHRLCVALHATRAASVGSRLPTNAAMAQSRSVRADDPRFARTSAALEGEGFGAECGHSGLSHAALHARERLSGRLPYGHKNKKGSKVHAAVDTLGHLLALRVSPANEDDRKKVEKLCEEIQKATGEKASESAAEHGIRLEVVKHEEAKDGFVLLPRRWVVERDFAWASRFRRLVKDYERLPETLAG